MDFVDAAKLRYYAEDNSDAILQKVNNSISRNITECRHELLCILDDIVSIEPCCYWNKHVFEETEKNLQRLVMESTPLHIDDEIFELFFVFWICFCRDKNRQFCIVYE